MRAQNNSDLQCLRWVTKFRVRLRHELSSSCVVEGMPSSMEFARRHDLVCRCVYNKWRCRKGPVVKGYSVFFFFQAEDGIRDLTVTGVQTCALPIFRSKQAPLRELLAESRLVAFIQRPRRGRGPRFADALQVQRRLDRAGKDVAAKRHHQAIQGVLARARSLEVAARISVVDTHDPVGRDVARAADRAGRAGGERRDEHGVAACEDSKSGHLARGDAYPLEVLEVPARVLDAADRAFARERGDGRGLDGDLGELRNVVDEDGHTRGLGDAPLQGSHARLAYQVVEISRSKTENASQAGPSLVSM